MKLMYISLLYSIENPFPPLVIEPSVIIFEVRLMALLLNFSLKFDFLKQTIYAKCTSSYRYIGFSQYK